MRSAGGGLTVLLVFWASCTTWSIPTDDARPVATTPQAYPYREAIDQAWEIARRVSRDYPGLAVTVGVGDSIVWSEGLGFADLQNKRPAVSSTRFRIYSNAKPLTAAAAARLAEEGKLDLDVPIGHYLPDVPEHLRGITARQLAGHLAGVRHYRGEWLTVSQAHCGTVKEALRTFENDPLIHVPGEQYAYSSYGYVLLSAVIEAASGQSFLIYLQGHLFAPAGMTATVLDDPGTEDAQRATFYEPAWFGRVKTARFVDNTCKWGAGGFLSTSEDLVRFGMALLQGRLVSRQMRDLLFTSMQTVDGEETGYGFGWGVGTDSAGRSYAVHSGGAIGGRSALYLLPDAGVVVAMLSNLEGDRLTDAAAEIAGLFARQSSP